MGFALLVGLLLLAGLVLFGSPSTGGREGRVLRVDADFSSIGSAVKLYAVNAELPPTTGQGLKALVIEPITGPKPKRWSRIMDRVPVDPWETPYRYKLLPPKGQRWRWELRSAGPDRVFGSSDDLAEETESGVVVERPPAEVGDEVEPRPSY